MIIEEVDVGLFKKIGNLILPDSFKSGRSINISYIDAIRSRFLLFIVDSMKLPVLHYLTIFVIKS